MNIKSHVWDVLAVAGTAQFLVLLESTVINVAIPSIGANLGDHGWLAWVVSGYLLAFGAFLLPGGVWTDRLGKRHVFLAGLAAFALASLLCVFCPTIHWLVAARAAQGASAGVLAASALGVVLSRYTDTRERAVAMTVWSTLGIIGSVVGSLVAGPLIAWLGWPGVFWVNVVAVALLLPIAIRTIPRADGQAEVSVRTVAAFIFAIGTALTLAGLTIAVAWHAIGVAIIVVGLLVIALVLRQQLRSERPILPITLLRHSGYRLSAAGLFLVNGVMIAVMFAVSRNLQDGYALSPQASSLAVLPMALASLATALRADQLITTFGDSRVLRTGAGSILLGTTAMLVVASTHIGWGWVVAGGAFVGAGLPACFIVLNRRAYGSVDPSESGAASGFTNTITTLGAATLVSLTAVGLSLKSFTAGYGVLLATAVVLGHVAIRSRVRSAS